MYTLYSPDAASMAVHWMLIELGVAFEARSVHIKVGEQRSPEYLRLNPTGRVPTLVVDGAPHSESACLLMLLAKRFDGFGKTDQPIILAPAVTLGMN